MEWKNRGLHNKKILKLTLHLLVQYMYEWSKRLYPIDKKTYILGSYVQLAWVCVPPYTEYKLKHTNKPIVFYYSNLKSCFIWISIMLTIRFAVHIMHIWRHNKIIGLTNILLPEKYFILILLLKLSFLFIFVFYIFMLDIF